MKIVEYVSADNVLVEFQDDYKYRKRTIYQNFKIGQIKNPYDKCRSLCLKYTEQNKDIPVLFPYNFQLKSHKGILWNCSLSPGTLRKPPLNLVRAFPYIS